MSERINFYGIEEVPPVRRKALDYERPRAGGHDMATRPRRWLVQSDYHRLLEREHRAPWAALFWLCFVLLCAAGLIYLTG